MASAVDELADLLTAVRRPGGHLLVVTGAGVSAASGLPTYRGADPGAVWRLDDVEMATRELFERRPVEHWRWFLERFSGVLDAEPNPAHRALVDLERWQTAADGGFLLVTQNVDTLHEKAGSQRLVKVHGTADRLRCSCTGCRLGAPAGSIPRGEVDLAPFAAAPGAATLPRCPDCGAVLRPHALFFDELYSNHRDYRFGEVLAAAGRADLVLFAGTSLSVGATDAVLRAALGRGAAVAAIDPAAPAGRRPAGIRRLAEPAELLLPATCAAVEGPPAGS